MTKLDFTDTTLQRLYAAFKWARNNSLQLFDAAQSADILSYEPAGMDGHSVLYQFQCLGTTTDTYYRRLSGAADTRFGVLLADGVVSKKEDIVAEDIKTILKKQLQDLEVLLRPFDAHMFEEKVRDIQAIANHEYLHQGQLVVLFRQAGVAIPERFREAFDL